MRERGTIQKIAFFTVKNNFWEMNHMATHNPIVLQSSIKDRKWLRHTLLSKNALLLGIFFLILSPALYISPFKAYISSLVALGILLMYIMGLIIVRKKAKYLPIYVMLISAFIPSPMIGFVGATIGVILFFINRPPENLDRFTKLVFLFVGFLTLTWLVHLGYTTDVWCLPLYLVSFCSYILVAVFAQWARWTLRELNRLAQLWILCIALQALPMFIKPLTIGEASLIFRTSDLNTGTLAGAHYNGVLLSILIIFLVLLSIEKRNWSYVWLVGVYTFLFYITATWHAILAMIPPAIGIGALCYLNSARKRKITYLFIFSFIFILLLGSAFLSSPFKQFISSPFKQFNRIVWSPYVINPANPKTILFQRTTIQLLHNGLNFVTGLGPGGYASRVASSRALGTLDKEFYELPSFIPPYTSPEYGKAVAGLYTYQIRQMLLSRSNLMSYPFSSLVGIWGELGIIGTVILVSIYVVVAKVSYRIWRADKSPVWRAFGGTALFAVLYLWALALFDSYMEQPSVMIPFWILFLLVFLRNHLLLCRKNN